MSGSSRSNNFPVTAVGTTAGAVRVTSLAAQQQPVGVGQATKRLNSTSRMIQVCTLLQQVFFMAEKYQQSAHVLLTGAQTTLARLLSSSLNVRISELAFSKPKGIQMLRGGIVNRTYCTHKNLYIPLFLLTTLGPIYYGPRISTYIVYETKKEALRNFLRNISINRRIALQLICPPRV